MRPDGTFEPELPLVGGVFFKDADARLVADLSERGLLFRQVAHEHSYPHCWRCHTETVKYGRYGDWLENAAYPEDHPGMIDGLIDG